MIIELPNPSGASIPRDFLKIFPPGKKTLRGGGARGVLPARPRGRKNLFSHTAMAYAVIKTGGKQYRVQQGTKFDVEKLDAEVDSEITFDALLVGEGESVKIGTPTVAGASVTAKVLSQFRGPKGVAFKFKRRKGFHKTKGFRRCLTKLEVTSIAG
jgi:large subunit ribosomal protein L21